MKRETIFSFESKVCNYFKSKLDKEIFSWSSIAYRHTQYSFLLISSLCGYFVYRPSIQIFFCHIFDNIWQNHFTWKGAQFLLKFILFSMIMRRVVVVALMVKQPWRVLIYILQNIRVCSSTNFNRRPVGGSIINTLVMLGDLFHFIIKA